VDMDHQRFQWLQWLGDSLAITKSRSPSRHPSQHNILSRIQKLTRRIH
jgi:hypothetical protein